MKLASGDMLTFRLDSRGCVIQCIGRDDVPRVEKEGRGWRDGDSAYLRGTDVALLLHLLTTVSGPGGIVVAPTPSTSMLCVTTAYEKSGKFTVILKTDNNEIRLKAYERDMFVTALGSQVWRFFQ
jgi:hypothetical protein